MEAKDPEHNVEGEELRRLMLPNSKTHSKFPVIKAGDVGRRTDKQDNEQNREPHKYN